MNETATKIKQFCSIQAELLLHDLDNLTILLIFLQPDIPNYNKQIDDLRDIFKTLLEDIKICTFDGKDSEAELNIIASLGISRLELTHLFNHIGRLLLEKNSEAISIARRVQNERLFELLKRIPDDGFHKA